MIAVLSTIEASAARQARPTAGDVYPDLDNSLQSLAERGLRDKALSRAVEERPRARETLELILDQGYSRQQLRYVDVAFDTLWELASGDGDDVEYAAGIVARNDRDLLRSEAPERRTELEHLVAALDARLEELPREQAARAAYQLIWVQNRLAGRNSAFARARMQTLARQYAGTGQALIAEVTIIGETRDVGEEIAALDAFIDEHPASLAGAAALRAKANAIRNDRRGYRETPPRTDPTPRFFEVLAIAEELESGRWPASQYVDDAPGLVIDFYFGDRDRFAAGNLDRMAEAYLQFVRDHARQLEAEPSSPDLDSAIYKFGRFGERQGDRVGAVERGFDALEDHVTDLDGLRHRRASFYISESEDAEASEAARAEALRKAFATLATLSTSSNARHARRADGVTAALHFREGQFEAAIAAYRSYLDRWPEGTWDWLAAVRIGQAHERLDDWAAAAATYRAAAERYPAPAPAAVITNTLAARASESLGLFEQARSHYAAAAATWDDDFGENYWTFNEQITHAVISERIADLSASLSIDEGERLQSGRRLIEREAWTEATEMLETLVDDYPDSPVITETRYLHQQARLEQAFAIADVASDDRDEAAAADILGSIATEPWTPAVGAARLALAVLAGRSGDLGSARALTREALDAWNRQQQQYYASTPDAVPTDESLRADVATIRDLLFLPLGGETYEHEGAWWNAFDWPSTMPAYLIVDPEMTVRLAGGRNLRLSLTEPPPGLDNVLFLSDEHRGFLVSILERLGGTEKRQPRAIMEVPNQPIGASRQILDMWGELFPTRPGHWGGWVLTSYPRLARIEFRDEARTRAAVPVTIGYSGCTAHLEKQDGRWVVTRLSNFWIT